MGSYHQSILVTGDAGFIGSNFFPHILKAEPLVHIVNLDKLTFASSWENLTDIFQEERRTFIKRDICDRSLVSDVFSKHQIKGVIHFAAESHVDGSIKTADNIIKTNIKGTFTFLNAAKTHTLMENRLEKQTKLVLDRNYSTFAQRPKNSILTTNLKYCTLLKGFVYKCNGSSR